MRHRELKVGMNIIGKPNNGYAITNQYSTCKVLQVNGLRESIFVEVISSNDAKDVGTRWLVDYKLFVKADVYVPVNEMPIPFPVGSFVIGNSKNKYGQTCCGCVCKVMGYKDYLYNELLGLDSEYMWVAIVTENGTIRGSFAVKPLWFDACDYKPYNGLFSKAYHRKLFTIENGVPIIEGVNVNSHCYKQLIKECIDNGLIKK